MGNPFKSGDSLTVAKECYSTVLPTISQVGGRVFMTENTVIGHFFVKIFVIGQLFGNIIVIGPLFVNIIVIGNLFVNIIVIGHFFVNIIVFGLLFVNIIVIGHVFASTSLWLVKLFFSIIGICPIIIGVFVVTILPMWFVSWLWTSV